MKLLHPLQSWAFRSSCCHASHCSFISCSVDLLQVVFSLPLFLLPWGFHVRACLVIDFFSSKYMSYPLPFPPLYLNVCCFLCSEFPRVGVRDGVGPVCSSVFLINSADNIKTGNLHTHFSAHLIHCHRNRSPHSHRLRDITKY